MTSALETIFQIQIEPILRAILIMVMGYFTARILTTSITKTLIKHMTPQQAMLLRRILFYFILTLFIASAIQQLGFHISALLGAAGILTVAIGIASQTSMSNIISGIFMIGEKPFEVGHLVKVVDLQGEILSIDLLSVKIRTPDNTLVRIPNETLIKSPIINLSWFPIRRADLKIAVDFKVDIAKVSAVLLGIAKENPLALMDPAPAFYVLGFGESGIELQLSVWASRNHFVELKNSIQIEIHQAFKAQDIQFPSKALYSGGDTEPLPVRILTKEGS